MPSFIHSFTWPNSVILKFSYICCPTQPSPAPVSNNPVQPISFAAAQVKHQALLPNKLHLQRRGRGRQQQAALECSAVGRDEPEMWPRASCLTRAARRSSSSRPSRNTNDVTITWLAPASRYSCAFRVVTPPPMCSPPGQARKACRAAALQPASQPAGQVKGRGVSRGIRQGGWPCCSSRAS